MHKKWTRRVAGQKKLPSRAFVTLMLHLTTMSATTSATWQCRGVARAIAHCMPSSCVSCKKTLHAGFFLPCEIFARCRFPRARAADAASAFLLSLRVRGPSKVAVVLSEDFFSRAAGARETWARSVQNGGAKEIKPMLGRSCALRDFAHSEFFNFASCKQRFYVEKLEEKSCLIREHFFRGDSPLIRQQSLIREGL